MDSSCGESILPPMEHILLIALDSVGIDPLGHNRADSVYAHSRLLFPAGQSGDLITLPDAPIPGAVTATEVVDEKDCGGIECAITYTSIFSGQSALDRHGLLQGLGLKERGLREMIVRENLFRRFRKPCLANAIFPLHLIFLGSSYVEDVVPHIDLEVVEANLRFDDQPVRLRGAEKHGFAELFTLAEINQNIFVYAARDAQLALRTWDEVQNGQALTSSMTHELEAHFNWEALGQSAPAIRTPQEAARILATLAAEHDFTFYKYQLADLVSHTGRVDLARGVFGIIETFVEAVLTAIDPATTSVIITSDHGHLEQVGFSRGHPKSRVPTWYFGPDAERQVARMRRPEAIFHLISEFGSR